MTDSRRKFPGPDHPITVTESGDQVEVFFSDTKVASTDHSVILQEASYPAVRYIPQEDVDQSLLLPSDHKTYCPYKGECSYHHLKVGDVVAENAVWVYRHPYDAVASIAGHLAFYPNRVTISVE